MYFLPRMPVEAWQSLLAMLVRLVLQDMPDPLEAQGMRVQRVQQKSYLGHLLVD